jgi:hypothetical protein
MWNGLDWEVVPESALGTSPNFQDNFYIRRRSAKKRRKRFCLQFDESIGR